MSDGHDINVSFHGFRILHYLYSDLKIWGCIFNVFKIQDQKLRSLYFQFVDFYFIFNIILLCNYFLYISLYINIKKLKTNINDYL